jgi:hypothetical protein
MKLSKLFAGSSPKKNIFHMAQHDHMFSFVEIQQSNQQVGLKDYRLKQSKVHRAPCLHRPDAFSFCSFSSLSQLSLFAFCLPSRVSWYPVFPYTILQKVQQLAGPASRKAGHEKHDIICHIPQYALVYKHANIVSHLLLMIACRLHCFQNITLLDVK